MSKPRGSRTSPALETMVELAVGEQRRMRIEGFKGAMRYVAQWHAEVADDLEHEGRRRWGVHFDEVP